MMIDASVIAVEKRSRFARELQALRGMGWPIAFAICAGAAAVLLMA